MKHLLLLFLLPALGATLAAAPLNVMVFLVDDMGVMDTSVPFLTDAEGRPQRHPLNEFYRTPAMERLAAQGVRLNHFCAMSVCSPTRIALMTGQNAARHRTTNWINPDRDNAGPQGAPQWNWLGLKKGDVTLPSLLAKAGWRTLHVGKGHFGPRDHEGGEPLNVGFEVNVAGASFGAPGSYYASEHFGAKTKRKQHSVPGLEKYHGSELFLTEALTLEAKALLDDVAREGKPFFLYFSHYAVHAPFDSDPRFAKNYETSGKPASAQAFATLVEGMDQSLGDMLDHLDLLGLAEDTLVLFLGDNGSDAPLGHEHEVACAAPLRGKKGAHYEGGMRVPFIAAWARRNDANPNQQRLPIPAGVIQSQQAAVQDIFPSLLALAEVPVPAGHKVDGLDLRTLLTGKPDRARPERFLMHYPHAPHRTNYWTSLRDGEWKVIYHYFPTEVSGSSHYQLFHLQSDPYEQKDVATDKPDELRRMMRLLISELGAHEAVFPVNEQGQPMKPELP